MRGIPDTGRGLLTRAPAGLGPIARMASSMPAIGMALMGGSNMTTRGTTITTVITTGITDAE